MVGGGDGLTLRERNRARLKSDLREAVLDVFVEDGFEALSIERLAREVGCSKATVYKHFEHGLPQLLRDIYVEISDAVFDAAMASRASAVDGKTRLMAVADAVLDMAARPRRGAFYAHLHPRLHSALLAVLGRTSMRLEAHIAADLDFVAPGRGAELAVFFIGALREASVRVAQDPSMRADHQEAMASVLSALDRPAGA